MAKRKADASELRLVRKPDIGKRVMFDRATFMALDLYARDSMRSFQELADEAFADLLKKHGRPVGLKAALRKSAGVSAEVVRLKDRMKPEEKLPKPAGKKAGKKGKR